MIYRITKANTPGQLKVSAAGDGRAEKVYFEGHALLMELHAYATMVWDLTLVALLKEHGYKVEVTAPELQTNEKIAIWCRLYKNFKGVPYRVTPKETGMIRHMPMDEPLLQFYLDEEKMPQNATTWLWRGKQSISNLYTYHNQVRTAMAQPASKGKHPNHWSREHYQRLDGQGISEYMVHLRSLGLVARKHRDGSILDFIPDPNGTHQ